MLLCNPFRKDGNMTIEVEKLNWYNQLLLYSHDDLDSEPLVAGSDSDAYVRSMKFDPDQKLLSNVIEKICLVKLKEIVQTLWDPLSHTQSVRLVNLVRQWMTNYPTLGPNSKNLKDLTMAIITKIRDSIDNDVFIPMFPKGVYDSRTSGVSLFFQRQFWSAWKLLGSILKWHRILADTVIHDLAIRSLLNLYLIPALNLASEINVSDCLEKCRNVINALPREWSKNASETHPFLGRLEAFLISLVSKLDPASHEAEIKEICNLLKTIGAKGQAEKIEAKYL